MNNKVLGFTLTEILITLGVVGVVCAITLPTLIDKINMVHFKGLLKEDYSIMLQAHAQIAEENGNFKDGLDYCGSNNNTCLKNAFKKKLKTFKDCNSNNGVNKNKCFISQDNVKFLDGRKASSTNFNNDSTSGIVLSNGSTVAFYNDSPDCNYQLEKRCGWFTLDVNGFKPPNTWGKDIYYFVITNKTIIPCCSGNMQKSFRADIFDCKTTGIGCASEYLQNK